MSVAIIVGGGIAGGAVLVEVEEEITGLTGVGISAADAVGQAGEALPVAYVVPSRALFTPSSPACDAKIIVAGSTGAAGKEGTCLAHTTTAHRAVGASSRACDL